MIRTAAAVGSPEGELRDGIRIAGSERIEEGRHLVLGQQSVMLDLVVSCAQFLGDADAGRTFSRWPRRIADLNTTSIRCSTRLAVSGLSKDGQDVAIGDVRDRFVADSKEDVGLHRPSPPLQALSVGARLAPDREEIVKALAETHNPGAREETLATALGPSGSCEKACLDISICNVTVRPG